MHVAWVAVDLQTGLRTPELDDLSHRVAVAVRTRPGPVWATVQTNPAGGPLRELRGWTACAGPADHALLEPIYGLRPEVVRKAGYSAAASLPLQRLRSYDAVYVVGADTDACVLATALGLFDAGCQVVVPPSLTLSAGGAESHQAGLTVLERQLGSRRVVDP